MLQTSFNIDLPDWGKIILVIFSIIVGICFTRRLCKEVDLKYPKWIQYGFFILVTYIIGLFAILVNIALADSSSNRLNALFYGSRYTATVVDHTIIDVKKKGSHYRSIYEIQLKDGRLKRIDADYSSAEITSVGIIHEVFYNAEKNTLLILEAPTIIIICGLFIFSILLTMTFIGFTIYALGFDMTRFWSFCGKLGTVFILFLMVAFDSLMIYFVTTYPDLPIWVCIMLWFFIVLLSLSIIGYIRIMINKGGNDDEDEEEDDDEEVSNTDKPN